jgi:hypothetical protein
VPDVVGLVVRLEDSPDKRNLLDAAPYELFREAVEAGLVPADGMPAFGFLVGEAVKQGVLGFRRQLAGAHLPSPDAPWTDHAFQSRSGYYSTVAGQQMASLRRQRAERAVDRVVAARRLQAELEEAEDLIGETLENAVYWRTPRPVQTLFGVNTTGLLRAPRPQLTKRCRTRTGNSGSLNTGLVNEQTPSSLGRSSWREKGFNSISARLSGCVRLLAW